MSHFQFNFFKSCFRITQTSIASQMLIHYTKTDYCYKKVKAFIHSHEYSRLTSSIIINNPWEYFLQVNNYPYQKYAIKNSRKKIQM